MGVTDFVSEIKRLENDLILKIQHGLQGFIVKNIEGESTEANDLSHILERWVCCVNNSKRYQRFQKAFMKFHDHVR